MKQLTCEMCGSTDLMKQDGVFIASGIIDTRADEVVMALQGAGLTVKERIEENGWVCLVCK